LRRTPQAINRYDQAGVTKATALAFSAINRGLQPYRPNKEEMKILAARDRNPEEEQ
jgi:hypothetical protein